jgi:hypothetical protein
MRVGGTGPLSGLIGMVGRPFRRREIVLRPGTPANDRAAPPHSFDIPVPEHASIMPFRDYRPGGFNGGHPGGW